MNELATNTGSFQSTRPFEGDDFLRYPMAHDQMTFGRFKVLPAARALMLDGQDLSLGGRAFDLLVVLLRSRGRVVSKQEIVKEVWPTTFVDESNLRFQMGRLRKALAHERGRIKTIAGRGYLFADDEAPADDRVSSIVLPRTVDRPSVPDDRHVIVIIHPDHRERAAIVTLLRTMGRDVQSFASADEITSAAVGRTMSLNDAYAG